AVSAHRDPVAGCRGRAGLPEIGVAELPGVAEAAPGTAACVRLTRKATSTGYILAWRNRASILSIRYSTTRYVNWYGRYGACPMGRAVGDDRDVHCSTEWCMAEEVAPAGGGETVDPPEIGRASCREMVKMSAVGHSI